MKTFFSKNLAVFALILAISYAYAADVDPTRPTAEMADRIKLRIANAASLKIHALVAGSDGDGVALIGEDPKTAVTVRKGSVISRNLDSIKVDVKIRSVSPKGVEIEAESLAEPLFIAGGYTPLPLPENPEPELISYLESENVPIAVLLRLISDRTGVNISASDATKSKTVSIFLRNIRAADAVEEICRATGLWFRRELDSTMIRVTTMAEYSNNLNTFREEMTEMFTLLYPNVTEVAGAIYGLWPDRTLLSLGEDDIEDDAENDLSRRFERFRVIENNGGSQFLDMKPPQTSAGTGGGGNNMFSFSRGSAASRLTQWDQLRTRSRSQPTGTPLSSAEAKFIDEAQDRGDDALAADAGNAVKLSAANIFVTVSRKNNVLMVRTSDVRVMSEIRRLVKKLDVPTPMVLMEVKVLELDVSDNYEHKISWGLRDSDHNLPNGYSSHQIGHSGAGGAANIFADIVQTGMDSFNQTFAFKAISDNISLQLQLMQKDGRVKTLATPTLLVANNEVSRIFSGKEYPLVTGWEPGSTQTYLSGINNINPTVTIEKKDVGTMLLITPNINADKTVTLRLMQENSAVSPEKVDIPVSGGSGETRPIEYVDSRQIVGTFIANDGMLVMAGGLIRESEEDVKWRTPILGSVPLLGWLFRGTHKVKQRTELVVLIRPHVILTPMEGGRISEELSKALSAHPAADGRESLNIFRDFDHVHDVKDDAANITK